VLLLSAPIEVFEFPIIANSQGVVMLRATTVRLKTERKGGSTPYHGLTSVALGRFPSGKFGTFIPGLTSGAFCGSG